MIESAMHSALKSTFNSKVLFKYQEECKDLLDDFSTLFNVTESLGEFLYSKIDPEIRKDRKEHYMLAFHNRAKEHFCSSLLLISQGYFVDAVSLSRSSLEDILVMVNFQIDRHFFNHWLQDGRKFRIRPSKLRKTMRNHPYFKEFSHDQFERVYSYLSNIVHPKRQSINLMIQIIFRKRDSASKDFEAYTLGIVSAFVCYLLLLYLILLMKYPEDEEILGRAIEPIDNLNAEKYLAAQNI